jgi:hypothetical protein
LTKPSVGLESVIPFLLWRSGSIRAINSDNSLTVLASCQIPVDERQQLAYSAELGQWRKRILVPDAGRLLERDRPVPES